MKRSGILAALAVVLFTAAVPVYAQEDKSDGFNLTAPPMDVQLSIGFNYDLLRSLTNVSFRAPVGYFGLNLPLAPGGNLLSRDMVDRIFEDEEMFRTPENYKPTAGAGQSANSTVRVDVPMIGGVGTFAYTQNFNFDFNTALGGSSMINGYMPVTGLGSDEDEEAGFIALKGALRLPFEIKMGWETMTFGYAYRVNNDDNLIFALNLHRHLFSINTRLKADIDLLGYVDIMQRVDVGGSDQMDMALKGDLVNFSSEECNGAAQGSFNAVAWTPSIGVKWGRFRLDSRFGLDVKASGSANGRFTVPEFINLEDPSLKEIQKKFENFEENLNSLPEQEKFQYVVDFMADAIPRDTVGVSYKIGKMRWKMPQGHTLSFDILTNKATHTPVISVSYTKTFGEINLVISDISRETSVEITDPDSWLADSVLSAVDLAVKIDHIVMFHFNTSRFFANVGIAGIEAREGDNYALKDVEGLKVLRLGDVTMALPILSGGFVLGTRLQLQVEANILPLPALKTGVNYYF